MKTVIDEVHAQKKKSDKKEDLKDMIKKKHNEILMREKVHHQNYVDCV